MIGFKASFQLQLWYVRIFEFRVYQAKNRLLSPSVFHRSKTAQEHCKKGNKKAKFVLLNWNKEQPGQTTEQIGLIFVHFFMLRIVSLPNDDSALLAIQGISGSVGGPTLSFDVHRLATFQQAARCFLFCNSATYTVSTHTSLMN